MSVQTLLLDFPLGKNPAFAGESGESEQKSFGKLYNRKYALLYY
jgi:hypothetical protein